MAQVFLRPKVLNAKAIIGIVLSVLIIILQFNAGFNISRAKPEIQGCDPLGYSRQARLFRTSKTIPQGLKTDLPENVYQQLKTWADSTPLNSSEWYQMIAPHCHHFRDTSGLIIDQYPFGTGWLLSFLPEKQSRRWLVIISLASISIINIYKIIRENSIYQQLFRAFNVWVLFKIVEEFWLRSDSLAPSILIAMISAEIALKFAEPNFLRSKKKYIYSLFLGLLLGFSICLRPGNLFFSYAAILCLLLAVAFQQLRTNEISRIALIGGLGYLPGVLMICYFNWLNTGSPFHTTYTTIDTSFADNFSIIFNNIQRISADKGEVLLFIGFCGLLISLAKLIILSRNKGHRFIFRSIIIIFSIAWTSLISFIVLCLFKNIFWSYYLAAQLAFTSTLVCCCSCLVATSAQQQSKNHEDRGKANISTVRLISASLIGLSVLIGIQNLSTTKELTLAKNPLVSANPSNTMLWGDSAGSYLYWHYGLPTAKILFGSREAQADVISYLQDQGVDQYFMDENKLISQLSHIKQMQNISPVGEFKDIKIYKLNEE